MSKITVQSLEKHFGGDELFANLSFEVGPGMRLAVAGANGCGKSTLLRMLAGKIEYDSGKIVLDRGSRIGYVAQELGADDLAQPLLSWVLSALPSWNEFWQEWEAVGESGDERRMVELSAKQAEFESAYGYNPDHKARTILTGLGFAEDSFIQPLQALSGGWRERAKLARVLLQGADVLLLDEPTNHLDIEAVMWLEDYLLNFRGALVFVAHDRIFLNKVGSHVLFLGRGKATMRKGTFDEYLVWMEEHSSIREREAANLSAKIESEYSYINRFRSKARKSVQAQSKLKKVKKLEEELEAIQSEQMMTRAGKKLNFKLPPTTRGDKVAIGAANLSFAYEGESSIWKPLDFQLYRGKKVALAAPNGMGKSTLLKLVTGSLKPQSGNIKVGGNTQLAYFSQHQAEILNLESTALSEIRRLSDPDLTEQQLKSVLGLFLLGESYFERKVASLSGGEKSRLLLATLFLSGANLLVLDEPTNHLDIESREGLVRALKAYDGTLFFVAHDRYLLSNVAEEVWALGADGIEQHLGGFERYMEKTAEAAEAEAPQVVPCEKRKLTKDEKRRQAELRNALYRELKPLKKEYEKLEVDLEKALEDQAVLEEQMNDPATYDKPEDALKLNARYKEVEEWVEHLMERMGEIEESIEEVNSQFAEEDDAC